jgi:hypothetical protein
MITHSCDACGRDRETEDDTLCAGCRSRVTKPDFTADEVALLAAWRGPKCSDVKLRERAGLTPLQASVAALSLSQKITRLPGTSIREAARNLWH